MKADLVAGDNATLRFPLVRADTGEPLDVSGATEKKLHYTILDANGDGDEQAVDLTPVTDGTDGLVQYEFLADTLTAGWMTGEVSVVVNGKRITQLAKFNRYVRERL
jgi:hypothetical protein